MRLQADPAELAEACGDDPAFWCEHVFDLTGNEVVARAAEGVLGVPVRILIIAVLAVVANRLVRRAIRRLGDRIAVERTDRQPDWMRRAPALLAPGPPSVRAGARARTVSGLL